MKERWLLIALVVGALIQAGMIYLFGWAITLMVAALGIGWLWWMAKSAPVEE